MRELEVRIQFTTPCLGNDKKFRTERSRGRQKKRSFFLFSRTSGGKVILMPQWWAALLRDAAQLLGRFHNEVSKIRFALEVDGSPRPVPGEFYKRFYDSDRFSPHEAFFAGDQIGVSCAVPPTISDDDFWRLMELAGKYYGMSPYRDKEFGRFRVVKIERRGPQTDHGIEPPTVPPVEETSETSVAPKS